MKEAMLRFKKILKNLSPSFYEKLIYAKDWIRSERGHLHRRRAKRIHQNKKETIVVFLVLSPAEWSSLKTVYEACRQHPKAKPYIVVVESTRPIPEYREKEYIECLKFFRAIEPDAIGAKQENEWFDLRTLSPEIIFYQSPYNSMYPKPYDMSKVSRYAKICYIPYGYAISDCKERKTYFEIQYGRPLVEEAYAIFASNSSDNEYLKLMNRDIAPRKDICIFDVGSPRCDLIKWPNRRSRGERVIFGWTPRWEMQGDGHKGTNFFRYKDKLVHYFKLHPECDLIIRPHPLMFSNFIEKGIMTFEDVDAFKKSLLETENIKLDNEPNYQTLFEKTDALIMDYSSLIFEFSLTGKPMIYCDSLDGLNKQTKQLLLCDYIALNWEEMLRYIEMIMKCEDPNKEKRDAVIEKILRGNHGNVGKSILEICLDL